MILRTYRMQRTNFDNNCSQFSHGLAGGIPCRAACKCVSVFAQLDTCAPMMDAVLATCTPKATISCLVLCRVYHVSRVICRLSGMHECEPRACNATLGNMCTRSVADQICDIRSFITRTCGNDQNVFIIRLRIAWTHFKR